MTSLAAVLLLSITAFGCGGDDDDSDESDEDQEETDDAGEGEDDEDSGGDVEACLADLDLELTDDFSDLPISAGAGGGPPILNTVEGVGVTGPDGGAVAFVFDSPEEAQSALGVIGGGAVAENVLVVADAGLGLPEQEAIGACFTGGGAPEQDEEEDAAPDDQPAPAEPGSTPVNDNPRDRKIRECLEEAGQEVLPDSYDAGPSRPPPISVYYPDGSGSLGTIWVFDSEADAQQAEAEEGFVPHEGGFGRDGVVLWSFANPNPGADLVEDVEACAASEA